jgi:hypothetical protein
MFYTVRWKSHEDSDAGHINVEAKDEKEAKTIGWTRIQRHYEDELRDMGIEIVSVTLRDKDGKTPGKSGAH